MNKAKRFARKLFKARRGQEGQGMTEYIIIVVLIAIFLIAAVKLFGGSLDKLFRGSSTKLDSDVGGALGGGSGGNNP